MPEFVYSSKYIKILTIYKYNSQYFYVYKLLIYSISSFLEVKNSSAKLFFSTTKVVLLIFYNFLPKTLLFIF